MKRIVPVVCAALVSVTLPGQQIRIAAYNVEGLGATRVDYSAIARVVSNFDIVAAVDVANAGGLEKLLTELDTGWEAVMSEKDAGPRRLADFFGFIFNDRVELVRMLGAYPAPATFARPPYGARFRMKGSRFTFNLVACRIASRVTDNARQAELDRLGDVYRYYEKMTGNKGITILAGDFSDNRPRAFQSLIGGGEKDVIAVPGTMAGRRGQDPGFDHIFVSAALKPRIEKADVFSREAAGPRLPVYLVLKAGG